MAVSIVAVVRLWCTFDAAVYEQIAANPCDSYRSNTCLVYEAIADNGPPWHKIGNAGRELLG